MKKKNNHRQYYLIYALYAFVTLCAVYFSAFTKKIVNGIFQIHLYLDQGMQTFMYSGPIAVHLRQILALALTPIIIVAIPTAIYWGLKKNLPPYLIQIIWVLWIIVALRYLLSQ